MHDEKTALDLADRLDAVTETGADPELIEQAAAELRRLHLYAAGADQLAEVWKGRAQDFMNSRDRLLNANRHLWARLDRMRAGLSQPTVCGQWICEYPGDVFVVFDPMTDGARIVGAARTLREAGAILEAVGQEPPQPPKDKNASVVFTAPQGWGKTRDAKHLLKFVGLDRLVDDWMPGMPIQDRTLHLTNVPPDELVRLQLSCRVIAKGWPGRAMPPKDEPAPGEIR